MTFEIPEFVLDLSTYPVDMGHARGVGAAMVVDGKRVRLGVCYRHDDSPTVVATKLHTLANWIELESKKLTAEQPTAE